MMVPGFRPSRILQALGRPAPIGVPIGIPEPETKPAMTAGENGAQPRSPRSGKAATATSENRTPRQRPATTNIAADNAITLPAATAPPAVASANQIAATPIPSGSLNPSANAPPAQRPVPLVASEVPAVAERAEPAPPAEGPGQVATARTGTSAGRPSANEAGEAPIPAPLPDPPVSAAVAEGSGDVATTTSPEQRKITPSVASRARAKTRSVARSRRDATGRIHFALDEPECGGARPRLPRGFARARFVGTTPDGMWMLALPSNRIVVVPPPPGY